MEKIVMAIILDSDYKNFSRNYSSFLSTLCEGEEIHVKIGKNIDLSQFVRCENEPFACNTVFINRKIYIAYNDEEITCLNLTEYEEYACLMHEIGHIVNRNNGEVEALIKEIMCDHMAVRAGLKDSMVTALQKMRNKYIEKIRDIDLRIERLQN